MRRKGWLYGVMGCLLFGIVPEVYGQFPVLHQPPTFIERGETEILEFEVQQARDDQVVEALLFSRSSDQSSYRQREERMENNRVRFPLLIEDPDINSLEYYFVLRLIDGREITYPDVHEGQSPLRVDVVEPEEDSLAAADFIEYTILSPRPDETLDEDDVFIAIALFYDDQDVEGGIFRVKINGQDVTSQSEITPYVIKYHPGSIEGGVKQVQVLFEKDDNIYEVAGWDFKVASGIGFTSGWGEDFGQQQSRPPSGDVEIETRNQQIGGLNYDLLSGRVRVSGREGDLAYSVNGYLTTQESGRLQPQNRYSGNLRYGEWLHVQAGDVYPYFNGLSVSGRRVRGLNSEVMLMDDYLEAQFIVGQMNRSVSNIYQNIEFEEQVVDDEVVDTLYTLRFDEGGRGQFSQNIVGGRVAVGHRDQLQVAFNAIKIADDTTSISVLDNYNDVLAHHQDLTGDLRPADMQNLEQNPDLLNLEGNSPTPRGNFVAGTELRFSLDDERIRFSSEGAFSLLSDNMYGGPLNRQRAEEMGLNLGREDEALFQRLSRLIVINEHMNSPPFRYLENDEGELEIETFFPTSALASDSRLNLNYYDHRVQLRYRWIGPNHQSLANTTLRRDIAGINITDRFRLLENRIYVTLGYENLRDNLMDNRQSTLRTISYRSSVSWNPVNPDWPRLNISGRYWTWDNNVDRFNPFVADIDPDLERSALRNYHVVDGETLLAPSPRLRRTFSMNFSGTQYFEFLDQNHQLNLNLGFMRTRDRLFSYGDNNNRNLALRITSRIHEFSVPLRARVGYSWFSSESISGLSTATINGINLGGEATLMDHRLDLGLDLTISGNRVSTLPLAVNDAGDPAFSGNNFYEPAPDDERIDRHTNAYIAHINAEYEISNNHFVQGRVNFTNLHDTLGNMDSIPNDRILQFKYILRF